MDYFPFCFFSFVFTFLSIKMLSNGVSKITKKFFTDLCPHVANWKKAIMLVANILISVF